MSNPLHWVRTAIAVMAFGSLIERFDLFLKVAAPQFAERQLGSQLSNHGEGFANWAGLAFIIIGIVTIVVAWLRFARTTKDIDSQDEVASPGERFDLALAIMIGLLGASLALYLSRGRAADDLAKRNLCLPRNLRAVPSPQGRMLNRPP